MLTAMLAEFLFKNKLKSYILKKLASTEETNVVQSVFKTILPYLEKSGLSASELHIEK